MKLQHMYDGSLCSWIGPGHPVKTIRRVYSRHTRNISTGAELRACLRAGSSTDLGGYRIAYLCSDGGTLCPDCVRAELHQCVWSIRNRVDNGWRVIGLYHEGETDGGCDCDHCGKTIWKGNDDD